MEVSVREQFADGPLYPEVRTWLESQGFRIEVEAIPSDWDGGNVLFVHEDSLGAIRGNDLVRANPFR